MNNPSNPAWTVTPQPGYQVNSTAISGDGTVCLFGTSREYDSGQFAVYCHDADGALKWSDPIGTQSYQGVYWVALSDDGRYAAAGGTTGSQDNTAGFLRAYQVSDGATLLDATLPNRINQVVLSADGRVLVAVEGSTLRVFTLTDGSYTQTAEQVLTGQFCRSCDVSADGRRMVVGGTRDQEAQRVPAGMLAMYAFDGSNLECRSRYPCATGVLNVVILDDGSWWAGSRHDGKVMAFTDAMPVAPNLPVWTYSPPELVLDVAYALAIARRQDGEVQVVCGANIMGKDHGCLYAVQAWFTGNPGDEYRAKPLWLKNLQYDPNPGTHMDRYATLVTATDGQPEQGDKETPGNFYLYCAADGAMIWQFPTSLMNWPMAISSQANAIFGGSDDGAAYYWITA